MHNESSLYESVLDERGGINFNYLETFDRVDIEEVAFELQESVDQIRHHIDLYRAYKKGGPEAVPEWYREPEHGWIHRAKHALRCKERDLKKVHVLVERRKQEQGTKRQLQQSLQVHLRFYKAAREVLTRRQFEEIERRSMQLGRREAQDSLRGRLERAA